MSGRPTRESLVGKWVRSGRTETEFVYTRAPDRRTRPMETLELHPDGTYTELRIGPSDRSAPDSGRWELDGDTLRLHDARTRGSPRALAIVSADADRLVIRRPG